MYLQIIPIKLYYITNKNNLKGKEKDRWWPELKNGWKNRKNNKINKIKGHERSAAQHIHHYKGKVIVNIREQNTGNETLLICI